MRLLKGEDMTKPGRLQTVCHRVHLDPQLMDQDVNRDKQALPGIRLPLKAPWSMKFSTIQRNAVPRNNRRPSLPILKRLQWRRCDLERLGVFRGKWCWSQWDHRILSPGWSKAEKQRTQKAQRCKSFNGSMH